MGKGHGTKIAKRIFLLFQVKFLLEVILCDEFVNSICIKAISTASKKFPFVQLFQKWILIFKEST